MKKVIQVVATSALTFTSPRLAAQMHDQVASNCEIVSSFTAMPTNPESLADVVRNRQRTYLEFIEANSEQRQPLYLNITPLEIEMGVSSSMIAQIPEPYRKIGEREIALFVSRLREQLRLSVVNSDSLELEAWPTINDHGRQTWVFARYRVNSVDKWHWLDSSLIRDLVENMDPDRDDVLPMLPSTLDPSRKEENENIFGDILDFNDLYQKPRFSECMWTERNEASSVYAGWLPSSQKDIERKNFSCRPQLYRDVVCRDFPQPVRVSGQPKTFILKIARNGSVKWSSDIHWQKVVSESDVSLPKLNPIVSPPSTLISQLRALYEKEVRMFSGAQPLVLKNGTKIQIERRNSIQENNDLEHLVRYFEEQYRALGIRTERHEFKWRNINQTNLVAIIPGSLPKLQNHPVLIADHYDTAFEGDTFEQNKIRRAAAGANDNYTATAGVLFAARYLKNTKPKHDIWLVHLTGEEYPADDLGARNLVSELLRNKQKITALLLMDMIGFNPENHPDFQINSGLSRESMRASVLAKTLVTNAKLRLNPLMRSRYDSQSYLYNTDGLIFDEAGYPVVFFNEVMNRFVYEREGYHDTKDTVQFVNFNYAFEISRLVSLTAEALAHGD